MAPFCANQKGDRGRYWGPLFSAAGRIVYLVRKGTKGDEKGLGTLFHTADNK